MLACDGCCRPLNCYWPFCRFCGGGGGGAGEDSATAMAPYHHPQLHPVPVQPAFLPQVLQPSGVGPGAGDATDGAPQIELKVPAAPMPEELQAPKSEPAKQRVASSAPRRLDSDSRSSSWIFPPPAMLQPPDGPQPLRMAGKDAGESKR
jgi:hypothetical protein